MNFKLKIPATSANLGPGFDTLGLALSLYNYLEVDTNTKSFSFDVYGEGADSLTKDEQNLTYRAMQKVFDVVGKPMIPMHLIQSNEIPLSRGLGSSAAAIVGGLVAANITLQQPLSQPELVNLATQMEGHPDNVAPALLGGLVVSAMQDQEVIYTKLKPKFLPDIIIVIPDFSLSTYKAREVLPTQVSLSDAVFNMGRLGVQLSCFVTGNYTNFKYGCEDRLHQDYRSELIPGFNDVIAACMDNGGLGATLSGAGPTIIGFAQYNAKEIGQKMQTAFLNAGISSKVLICNGDTGTSVL